MQAEIARTPKDQDKSSPLSNTELPQKKTSSSQKLVAEVDSGSAGAQGGEQPE